MIRSLLKNNIFFNVFQRFNSSKCFLRRYSNFNDNKDNTKNGIRLPGATDQKSLWKSISYEYQSGSII